MMPFCRQVFPFQAIHPLVLTINAYTVHCTVYAVYRAVYDRVYIYSVDRRENMMKWSTLLR